VDRSCAAESIGGDGLLLALLIVLTFPEGVTSEGASGRGGAMFAMVAVATGSSATGAVATEADFMLENNVIHLGVGIP
jgi:hypothetical protein